MKKSNLLFTYFLFGSFVWAIGFLSLAAYAAQRSHSIDPEGYRKIAAAMGMKFNNRNFVFNFDQNEGDYTEHSDSWKISPPAKEFEISTISSNVEIITGDEKEIVIEASGQLNEALAPKLLELDVTSDAIRLQEPDGDVVRNLKVRVKVPRSFRGKLSLKSVSGEVFLEKTFMQDIEIHTVSGDMAGQDVSAGKIEINTVSGDVDVALKTDADLTVRTVSGDINAEVATDSDTVFSMQTISGEIDSRVRNVTTGKKAVTINSGSGDIKVWTKLSQ